MKNCKMILGLVLVLTMAGTTFAEFSMEVVQQVDPVPGLESYMVKVGGVLGFRLTIDGAVHQMNDYLPPGTQPIVYGLYASVFVGDIMGQGVACDTHYMLDEGDTLGTPSNDFSDDETSDMTNPYNCDDGYDGFYYFGMGTFTSDIAVEGFVLAAQLPAGTDLLQVVIPENTFVYLDGFLSESAGVHHEIHQMIGVPEPSTVLMLAAGVLCLLIVRFRGASHRRA